MTDERPTSDRMAVIELKNERPRIDGKELVSERERAYLMVGIAVGVGLLVWSGAAVVVWWLVLG